MGLVTAVKSCLTQYATFTGRASRSEFWWFFLFLVLGLIVTGAIDAALFGATPVQTAPGQVSVQSNGPVATVFSLAMLVPTLAAGWRRMHDSGRSGLYLLFPLIAMAGMLALIGVTFGFGALGSGDFIQVFIGVSGLIIVAAVVYLISPLLVLWWLTRPSEPGQNAYGAPA